LKARDIIPGWPRGRSTSLPCAKGTVWPWTYGWSLMTGEYLGEYCGPGFTGLNRIPPKAPKAEMENERAEERRKADMVEEWYAVERVQTRFSFEPDNFLDRHFRKCGSAGLDVSPSPGLHLIQPAPYPHETRNMDRGNAAYACEMSDDGHRQLADTLKAVKGMVIISGYPCDLYDKELYPTWKRIEREHLADGARKRTEVIWLNDACVAGLSQGRLFG
jgi:hypothetical protein